MLASSKERTSNKLQENLFGALERLRFHSIISPDDIKPRFIAEITVLLESCAPLGGDGSLQSVIPEKMSAWLIAMIMAIRAESNKKTALQNVQGHLRSNCGGNGALFACERP